MERGRGELTMSERTAGPGKLQASSGLHTMRRTRRGRIAGAAYSGRTVRLDGVVWCGEGAARGCERRREE
jgi:hypothetical protein